MSVARVNVYVAILTLQPTIIKLVCGAGVYFPSAGSTHCFGGGATTMTIAYKNYQGQQLLFVELVASGRFD